ncbi:MAG: class I SAM-dependent methyltransferase [Acidimicrobiales bacterium]|nr:class I SAM-dependent methyltransferase [Acidimicrobiales bacterium]
MARSAASTPTRRPLPRLLERLGTRVRRSVEPRIFPEAADGADQWQRVVMDRAIGDHLEGLGPAALSAVEISGDAQAARGWKEFRALNYPEFDLCAELDDANRGSCDVVVCEQVLEHVVDPFVAADHLFELLRPGGHAVVSTPFLIKQHELPLYGMLDYWRFTPRGLGLLLERSGFVVDHVDSWGSRLGVLGNLDRWSAHRPWLPLSNRRDLAVVVWAFAHRPAADA